jgi:antitoxin CptB
MTEFADDKKRLAWQCRRGMLELDVLLKSFLENDYDQVSDSLKAKFATLLKEEDPQLYAWLMRQETVPKAFEDIIHAIQKYTQPSH